MIGEFFSLVLIDPLTNLFVLLTAMLGNPGLAVIALTIIIRVVTFPLHLKQMRMTRTMAAMQPRLQEIQKKYRDPARRSQEQMKLYREMGVNPIGCFGSMLIQMPILIALYATFRLALGQSPEAIISLSGRLYDWDFLKTAIPLQEDFLWMNLGQPDPFIIPLTVALSTYVLQKMSTLPATDERQAAQNQMMNLLMPLIFGWITITLPSGLGLYYVLSNLIGMVMQYAYVGGGRFNVGGLLGLNKEPVLPKAMEARQKQIEQVRRTMEDQGEEEGGSKDGARRNGRPKAPQDQDGAKAPESTTASARRRRRYASGRRRSRR
jgi:YidC/Oxa1 family membrane protein insertase